MSRYARAFLITALAALLAASLLHLLAALALEGPSWLREVEVSTVATTVALRARVPHRALQQGWLSP